MKMILVRGRRSSNATFVDDGDYNQLSHHRWRVVTSHSTSIKYVTRSVGKREVLMHREIMGTPPPGMTIDHINHNGLDNRRSNLRIVTLAQNQWNRKSGFGAYYNKKSRRWMAQITVNKKRTFLGLHLNREEARKAYEQAVVRLRGREWLNQLTQSIVYAIM